MAVLALRVRTGATAPEAALTSSGFALRMMALAGTFYFAVGGVVAAAMWGTLPLFRRDILHGDLSDHGYWSYVVYALVVPALWLATFILLLQGSRRTGRVLAVLAFIGTIITVVRQRDTSETAVVASITVLAVLASFIRSAPPVKGRRWWVGTLALIGTTACVMFAKHDDERIANLVEITVTAAVLAIAVHVQKSPAWPLGLSALGLPFLGNWGSSGGLKWIINNWGYFSGHSFRPALAIEALFIAAAMFSVTRVMVGAWWPNRLAPPISDTEPPTAA
ncbi:hypothetical protein KGQ19_01485 [Catenulispora sp. NL8]|uniref:Integral membrane protein n=1 Tax=Catenulispora pinistramenti TaxID=2705254 RepID=A0ABS5KHE8_9ACTN|nr:hypothetical protein [Catenulispora pinistramenti]MBS2545533.1 hypothetical protein [Catenulispora pinistramenti]